MTSSILFNCHLVVLILLPHLAVGVLNSDTDCRFTRYGTSYRGIKAETRNGRTCQRWDSTSPHPHSLGINSLFPDETLNDASNYCRNPGGYRQGGVWCYTTDSDVVWEYCDVPVCDCRTTKAGFDYMGQVAVTNRNETCQRWDRQQPHGHTYVQAAQYPERNVTLANNYCRNPATWWEQGLWCYTTNPSVRWRHCDIPFCECKTAEEGLTYMGKVNITVSGKTCQRWDAQSPHEHEYSDDSMYPDGTIAKAKNFCRNPDDSRPGGPWCFTTDSATRWEYCKVPMCENSEVYLTTTPLTTPSTTPFTGPSVSQHAVTESIGASVQECKFTKKGTSYRGHVSHTVTGKTCQRWDTQQPHRHEYIQTTRFPDSTLSDASNFCRNPNGRSQGPWCYTTDAATEWEYCDVPICDCRITKKGVFYLGTQSVTESGYTCQRWDSQSPHRHPLTRGSYFADGDVSRAKNYCRTPTHEEEVQADHPWCFTTNADKVFEYCTVAYCECKFDDEGLQYLGQVSRTAEGKTCMRWDSQNPHSHNYLDDTMFPDGSVAAAENFCRNPDDMETGGPWCYTTDPNVRWQYCDIPKCEFNNPFLTTSRTTIPSTISAASNPATPTVSVSSSTSRSPLIDVRETKPPPKDSELECKMTIKGGEYSGTMTHTKSFRACQAWSSQSPHTHSYNNDTYFPNGLSGSAAYCRNPHGVKIEGPWCFTEDPLKEWEYCEIPFCACRQTRIGWEYNGTVTRTISGRDCQRWDKQIPHSHEFYDSSSFPEASVYDAHNYCRNPNKWNPKGPWCYTTDAAVEWEYCNIPFCECKSTKGGHDYGGKIAVTSSGKDCQNWASQYPHTHRYYESRNFPEDNVNEAQNYCRNPEPKDHEGPWCYTTDPNTRWEYCDIKLCDETPLAPKSLASKYNGSGSGAVIGGILGGIAACVVLLLIIGLVVRRYDAGPAVAWKKEVLNETPKSRRHQDIKVPPMAEEAEFKKPASFDNPIYSNQVVYEKKQTSEEDNRESANVDLEDKVTLSMKEEEGETEA